jgi:hypothetical protein
MLSKAAVALACAAVAMPLVARADAVPDTVQKTLASAYQLDCTAAQDPTDANIAAAFGVLTPDFEYVDLKGKQTGRDEFIAQGKQQLKQLHITSCTNTVASETLSDPNTVVVIVTAKFVGQIQAPDGNHDIDATSKSQDTWKLVGGTWMQSQSKEVSNLLKVDGKVVQDEGE